MRFLFLLFLPIMTFAQQQECKEKKVTYSLQLFSTKAVQLFDKSKIAETDSIVIEDVCIKGEKVYRVLIPQEGEMYAEEAKERYSKHYKDCFIVKYIDGKRYN
jgi:hypothetical protein